MVSTGGSSGCMEGEMGIGGGGVRRIMEPGEALSTMARGIKKGTARGDLY